MFNVISWVRPRCVGIAPRMVIIDRNAGRLMECINKIQIAIVEYAAGPTSWKRSDFRKEW